MTTVEDTNKNIAYERLAQYPAALEAYEFGLDCPEANHVPEPEELVAYWSANYDQNASMRSTDEVYGTMRTPDLRPRSVVSVDLCEVTRESCSAFMALGGFTLESAGATYGYGLPYGIEQYPDIVTRMLQALMIRDQVEPVAGIDDIRTILNEARENGAYIVANTSTLPGCELATVRWLAKYLPNCFDALVLPRNHDGKGAITKGTAKQVVMRSLLETSGFEKIHTTAHIDDAPHHIRAVRETAKQLDVVHADFTPKYVWNIDHPDMNHQETPLESFEQMADVL